MELSSPGLGTEQLLKQYVREAKKRYDYVVLDLPPTVGLYTMAGYLACDSYVIPVKPDPLSRIGLPLLERALEKYEGMFEHSAKRLGIVLTLVRGTKAMKKEKQEVRAQFGADVLNEEIPMATAVSEAVDHGLPLQVFAKSRKKVGAALTTITSELVDRV